MRLGLAAASFRWLWVAIQTIGELELVLKLRGLFSVGVRWFVSCGKWYTVDRALRIGCM